MLNTLMNDLLPCLGRLTFLLGCCESAEADAGLQSWFSLIQQQVETYLSFYKEFLMCKFFLLLKEQILPSV